MEHLSGLSAAKHENYELAEVGGLDLLLASLKLDGYNVLELGFGQGSLSRLIMQNKPSTYVGVDINRDMRPGISGLNVTLRYGDLRLGIYDFLSTGKWVLIANPPSECLDFIKEEILDKYPLHGVVLVCPSDQRQLFADYTEEFHFRPEQFLPPHSCEHVVLKSGFTLPGADEPAPEPGATEYCAASVLEDLKLRITSPDPSKKLGKKRRLVVLLTNNHPKLPEFEKNCGLYGIEVYLCAPIIEYKFIRDVLCIDIPDVTVMSVFKEESNLYSPTTSQLVALEDLNLAYNTSVLQVFSLSSSGALKSKTYEHTTRGYVDTKRRSTGTVFGWDDIFVVSELNKTYHDLALEGRKVSSRDMNISKYIADCVHYVDPVNLTFAARKNKRVIDFKNSVTDTLKNSPFLANAAAKENGIYNFFQHSAWSGVFFRAALNRRQKNYWWPGLNAGLPFTPKNDELHESTYMSHDFIHFMIPDLIFTGAADEHSRKVYTTYRMMSEGLTLVFSDMIFADTLKRACKSDYDFKKRCFHPVYEACGLSINSKSDMQKHIIHLLRANVDYTLKGDDSALRELIRKNGGDESVLVAYKDKYMPFFVEDFRWTDRNYANMTRNSYEFKKWWPLARELRDHVGIDLQSIEEFIAHFGIRRGMKRDELIDRVFSAIYQSRIAPVLEGLNYEVSEEMEEEREACAQGKAFARYMMGQLALCTRFSHLPESTWYSERLVNFIKDESDQMTYGKILRARKFYEDYVDILQRKNLISIDDASTYKEIYPLFDPFYVFYDEDKAFYKDLSTISAELLG